MLLHRPNREAGFVDYGHQYVVGCVGRTDHLDRVAGGVCTDLLDGVDVEERLLDAQFAAPTAEPLDR